MDRLEGISEYLDLTIDFGWLWWIAKPIFKLLLMIHDVIGNWGWSIIALTCIIKAVFFYPSAVSYRSMAKMRKLSPKMQRLKELHGDDRWLLTYSYTNASVHFFILGTDGKRRITSRTIHVVDY